MDVVIELFKQPGFTAIVSGISSAILGFLANSLLQWMRAKDRYKLLQYKMGVEEKIKSLQELIIFANKLSNCVDPEEDMKINRFTDIMSNIYDSKLEVRIMFVRKKLFKKLKKLDSLYGWCQYAYLNDSYKQLRAELRKEIPQLATDVKRLAIGELRELQ